MESIYKLSVTKALIIINVLFFIIWNDQMSFGLNSLNMYNPIILVTSMFTHVNIIHLALNMISLLQIGILTEKITSPKRVLSVYLLSGLGGGLVSILFINFGHNVNVMGASGAIFGLYTYYALLENKRRELIIQIVILHAIFFITNLPVAWYAHLGGIVVGYLFFLKYRKKTMYTF
jgi:membrane associated rhomboid family serine protease